MTIQRLLVANRGEIARRIFATCRELGIEAVAVHSDADAAMPFVAEADTAVRLPGNTPAETYLHVTAVLEAAHHAGADAVHPGYGFLSEDPAFARAVEAAGLTWVGPRAASMEQMASKVEAKKLMADAGVPVLPQLDPAAVRDSDLPLLVKASAGGGGRGMRVVRTLSELTAAVDLASKEAASAFGDPTVFCEPYVERGRHVEVQIMGDHHGTVVVLGDRDCSLQRRHQKVVEEAPAPGLSDATRAALHAAALGAGTAIAYVGAGTVEFLVDRDGDRFWFLEMNTRLQVEHPVTECVTGLDLVAIQISVAEGGTVSQLNDVPTNGHAVEVRLYAEDPSADWQPQSGRLDHFEIPGVVTRFARLAGPGIRLDSGVESGTEVGTYYDALLAKVIAWAPTRDDALRRLAGVLSRARIHGVSTNRDLLVGLLMDPVVAHGEMHTTYLDQADVAALASGDSGHDALELSAFAAAVALAEQSRAAGLLPATPLAWRNVVSQPQRTSFEETDVLWYGGQRPRSATLAATVVASGPATVTLEHKGVRHVFDVRTHSGRADVDSSLGHVTLTRKPRFPDPASQLASGSLLAPMPGSVVAVHVSVGERVTAGQAVLVLEAMKMQHNVTAPADGVVIRLDVTVGQQVNAGDVLALVDDQSTADNHEETDQ